MDARLLTILFAGVFFWVPAHARDLVPQPAADPGEFIVDACTPPRLETTEESFQINPELRQRFYDFSSQGGAVLVPRDRKRSAGPPDGDVQFLVQGRFRLFVLDLFDQNAKLLLDGRKVAHYWNARSEKQEPRVMKNTFKSMEKLSNRLSKKLSILVSDEFDEVVLSQTTKSFYNGMAIQGQYEALLQLLLNKLNAFEHRLCNLFFPSSFTVSLEDLSAHSTPYVDIREIHAICRALASNYPVKGVPPGLNP